LLGFTVVVAGVFVDLPRIPQPQSYHHFSDQRTFLGIRNFGDVASNLPFAVIGLWGLWFLTQSKAASPREASVDPRERWPYLFVFSGLLLTAFGSSYYHLAPDNARLVWDRLPIMIVFTSLVAAVVTERVNVRAGLWLLPVLLAIGTGSVLQWYASELRGAGDLRLYAAVQVYSGLVLLFVLLFPPRYTRASDLAVVVGFYVLAKALEVLDRPIFNIGRLVSGHTLKHFAAAAAGYWILRMVQKRRPIGV
jgi:Flp pilus assembly protein protease CpaA